MSNRLYIIRVHCSDTSKFYCLHPGKPGEYFVREKILGAAVWKFDEGEMFMQLMRNEQFELITLTDASLIEKNLYTN